MTSELREELMEIVDAHGYMLHKYYKGNKFRAEKAGIYIKTVEAMDIALEKHIYLYLGGG